MSPGLVELQREDEHRTWRCAVTTSAAIAPAELSLREVFSILDKEGTGEINPDAFIAGIQELEGHLSVVQCTRLMEQIDTDCSGTVDFNELTRALQKLDLRIDITDYLVVCLRFFCSEMKRSPTSALRRAPL